MSYVRPVHCLCLSVLCLGGFLFVPAIFIFSLPSEKVEPPLYKKKLHWYLKICTGMKLAWLPKLCWSRHERNFVNTFTTGYANMRRFKIHAWK
ncbi:hypothetical protein AWC38_SpisGene13857 [Stylophora pistillata]|uniref:Uncharacterized protein n=1 Tax=Stylophora pistillata TaxID=50429 RepID=A0A2B4RZ92_STYPI|nr:hypothetical protein AWC38_SpisGene13857 [Stylophora pistillata]